jgi:hypothetical protein
MFMLNSVQKLNSIQKLDKVFNFVESDEGKKWIGRAKNIGEQIIVVGPRIFSWCENMKNDRKQMLVLSRESKEAKRLETSSNLKIKHNITNDEILEKIEKIMNDKKKSEEERDQKIELLIQKSLKEEEKARRTNGEILQLKKENENQRDQNDKLKKENEELKKDNKKLKKQLEDMEMSSQYPVDFHYDVKSMSKSSSRSSSSIDDNVGSQSNKIIEIQEEIEENTEIVKEIEKLRESFCFFNTKE